MKKIMKMADKFKKACLVFTSVFILGVGCKNIEDFKVDNFGSSSEELEKVYSMSEDNVDYKMSRTLAMLELADFEEVNGWSTNAILSEKPVVIWENINTPVYYEFAVIDNNENVGYVTCNINKKNGEPVVYIGTDKREYNETESRQISSGKSRIYADNYPSTKVINTSRAAYDESINEDNLTKDELFYLWVETIPLEEFEKASITKEEFIQKYEDERKKENERLQNLWTSIENASENIYKLTDFEILTAIKEIKMDNVNARATIMNPSTWGNKYKDDYYLLEPYASYIGNNHFRACVPSVIEFVAQAYTMDKNELEKLTNTQITKIKDCIMSETGDRDLSGTDPSIQNAVSKTTNGDLTAPYVLNHDFSFVKDNIINYKLPVMSVRFNFATKYNIYDFTKLHCRCVTGVCEVQNKVSKYFLWITWDEWVSSNYYYLWDNGYDYDHFSGESSLDNTEYINKHNNHFWEKDQTFAYCGTFPIRYK